MGLPRRFSRKNLVEFALAALIYGAFLAAGEWLPRDGWGLVLRWVVGIVFFACLLWGLASLLASSVREFRRGLAGEKGRAS